MLIGDKNKINKKLVQEIEPLVPIQLVDSKDFLLDRYPPLPYNPKIFFINLMDVGAFEGQLLSKIKVEFINSKTIALHCFETRGLIQKTLAKGYDAYIPVLKFSEELGKVITKINRSP